MAEPSWLIILWEIALVLAVVLSGAFGVFLFTLPNQFEPTERIEVTQDDFTDDDKAAAEKSGYDHYMRNRNEDGIFSTNTTVHVVVLGDIGRSPRMQYHALSIAAHGGLVNIIGYVESDVHPDITAYSTIKVVPLDPLPEWLRTLKLPFIIVGPLKALWQTWSLYHTLAYRTKPPKWMLVQNPPSIPTLAVARLVCTFRNTRLVIDWHNFGYSILAMRLGSQHLLVRLSNWYEKWYATSAERHFVVTDAMKRVLKDNYGVEAKTLHDRPPEHFQPLSSGDRSMALRKLECTSQYATEIENKTWRLIVSSTSWTPDEDFSLLLDALVSYSSAISSSTDRTENKLPKILAIITGKGPQKQLYLDKIAKLNQEHKLQNVIITTAWLSTADYATLLASADLGISLHTSSSGVDLPMKVVDMFGTGLPVAGWSDFEAWPELVREGINGRGFASADGLKEILTQLFGGDGAELERLRKGALEECGRRWDGEWMPVAGRMFALDHGPISAPVKSADAYKTVMKSEPKL